MVQQVIKKCKAVSSASPVDQMPYHILRTAHPYYQLSSESSTLAGHKDALPGLLEVNRERGLGGDLDKEQDCCMQILHCMTIPDFSVTKVLLCYLGKMLFNV